jgi:hypothetical protein
MKDINYCLLGYNAVYFVESHPGLWSNRRSLLATCFHAGFLLGLIFNPEDMGNMFL